MIFILDRGVIIILMLVACGNILIENDVFVCYTDSDRFKINKCMRYCLLVLFADICF